MKSSDAGVEVVCPQSGPPTNFVPGVIRPPARIKKMLPDYFLSRCYKSTEGECCEILKLVMIMK